jgi:hypothetical protein
MKKIILLFSILIISSCNYQNRNLPDCGFHNSHINNEIKTGIIQEWSTFKVGEAVTVYISYIGNEQVKAPSDFNLKIFYLDPLSKNWVQIQNNVQHINQNAQILGSKVISENETMESDIILNSAYRTSPASILLKLENTNEPIEVFYCVSGIHENKNTLQNYEVGATGSFILQP